MGKRHWSAALLAIALASSGCSRMERPATAADSAPPQAVAPDLGVPPIRYSSRTLANGLRVFSIPDETGSTVAIQVWYGVGGRDDPRGRSGFAHLFEHMMFKATRNMVPEQFDRLTEDVGGANNAFTSEDVTGYHEVVPANHLERLLWAEAERMGSLVVEPGYFASERDVVKEELRSRVEAAPYGRLISLYYPAISYSVHPYARMVAGSLEDLDAATIEDVRAFHATYYRPDNAVLVVAGNFDQAQLDRWVDLYFGTIERPDREIPRVTAVEPERTRAATYTVYERNTPLPAVLISYPAPPVSHDDSAALEVLDGILSTGESSRLHQSLVYRQRIAAQASSFPDLRAGPGNIVVYAILSEGQSADAGMAALRAEVARLRDSPVSAAELEEARNELLSSALRERETAEGIAGVLAQAVTIHGDPEAADRRLARIAAVTAADVQRVAAWWLRDERSAALNYLPEEMRPNPQAGDRIALAPTVVTRPLETPPGVRVVSLAPEGERIAPPAPGTEVVAAIPQPVTQTLANGLKVVTVQRRELPLVSVSLVATDGAALDPEGRAGRAALTAALMTEGTRTRSATEIDQAVEALGTSLDSGAAWDGASLGLTIRTSQLDTAMGLLADVARNPALSAEELERQRAQAIDAFTVSMGDPGAVARMAANRVLFGSGPYGHPQGGTATTLRAIGPADIVAAHQQSWRPENATLVIAGDVDPQSALALAERHFGSWAPPHAPPRPMRLPQFQRPPRNDVLVIDFPGAGQAAVAVARIALPRRDPRYYRAVVANAVLGGGYSSRLNQEIRIRRGLAYGAGSGIDGRRSSGPFVASTQTRNETAAEVLGLILAEMRRLGAEPIPPEELGVRRAVILADLARTAETTQGLAGLISAYVINGAGPDEIARYQQAILAVTPEQAQSVAADVLAPEGSTMVIVGDSRLFLDRLRRDRANVTVIPIGSLNLDSPTLR